MTILVVRRGNVLKGARPYPYPLSYSHSDAVALTPPAISAKVWGVPDEWQVTVECASQSRAPM